jgi:hypothetical protein
MKITMKKITYGFLFAALLVLMTVPVINLTTGTAQKPPDAKWWRRSVLYNFDIELSYLSRVLYPLGISIDPNQAMIGKSDWLFLGDQYEKEITANRQGVAVDDIAAIKKIGVATQAWAQWLQGHGVSMVKIMLCPNKGTVYPEFLPRWAQPAGISITDTLLSTARQGLYFDTRSALKAAKVQFPVDLYYKTDTHWNSLAAWVAFRAFMQEVHRTEDGLRLLSDQQVRVSAVSEIDGGDLANFLRMKKVLRDKTVYTEILIQPLDTEQYDFVTGHLMFGGPGNPQVAAPQQPLLVRSKNALNQKKVLWLHDSFGNAMSPFMAATFSETLQLHYNRTNPTQLAKLVETYKPDFVFITVVERESRIDWFGNLPPKS